MYINAYAYSKIKYSDIQISDYALGIDIRQLFLSATQTDFGKITNLTPIEKMDSPNFPSLNAEPDTAHKNGLSLL